MLFIVISYMNYVSMTVLQYSIAIKTLETHREDEGSTLFAVKNSFIFFFDDLKNMSYATCRCKEK